MSIVSRPEDRPTPFSTIHPVALGNTMLARTGLAVAATATTLPLALTAQWCGVLIGALDGWRAAAGRHSGRSQEAATEEPVTAIVPVGDAVLTAPVVPQHALEAVEMFEMTEATETVAPVAPVAPTMAEAVLSATIMPEDFEKPRAHAKPDLPDDLKTISGIGPKIEGLLNGLGIWTFAQIAAWTPNEVAWIDDYLQFKGRIGRESWIAQATALAAGSAPKFARQIGKTSR